MLKIGEWLGARVTGGEVFELVGDVGAGKTTFTRGLADGMSVRDHLQSPTFTVSREYNGRDELRLVHYDFYRLGEAGIMADEIAETVADPKAIIVVEWSDVVAEVLPVGRATITLQPVADDENARELTYDGAGVAKKLLEECERVFTA